MSRYRVASAISRLLFRGARRADEWALEHMTRKEFHRLWVQGGRMVTMGPNRGGTFTAGTTITRQYPNPPC